MHASGWLASSTFASIVPLHVDDLRLVRRIRRRGRRRHAVVERRDQLRAVRHRVDLRVDCGRSAGDAAAAGGPAVVGTQRLAPEIALTVSMGRNAGEQAARRPARDDWSTHDQSLDGRRGAGLLRATRRRAVGASELVARAEQVLPALVVVVREPVALRVDLLILELVGEVQRLEREVEVRRSPSSDAEKSMFSVSAVPSTSLSLRPGTVVRILVAIGCRDARAETLVLAVQRRVVGASSTGRSDRP